MKIIVKRVVQTDNTTLSVVSIDGRHQCFGLENPYHKVKVAGNTRIPAGTYPVELRTTGGKHQQYKDRFDFHEGMLHVKDVPGFKYILIHIGNFHRDTDGCLLVGTFVKPKGRDYMIGSSRIAYLELYGAVIDAAKQNILAIEFIDD